MNRLLDSSSSESDEEEILDLINKSKQREFKPRVNFYIFEDFQFCEQFRVSRETVEYILQKVGRYLQHDTSRNFALSPEQQLLTALTWFGTGCQYHSVGKMLGISKSTVHRCVKRVSEVIVNNLFGEEIRWPNENVHDIAVKFSRISRYPFPCVAGAVDGTLINIDAPAIHEEAYVDRYGNHSINALMVCGPDRSIYYCNANWPGSVHDARILRNSSLAQKWNHGWRPFPHAIILGDSAFGLSEWLIPPILHGPVTESATRFLRAHKSTRRIVENSFGVMKEKFPCLNHLRVEAETAGRIILCVATLFNIENRYKSIANTYLEEEDENDEAAQREEAVMIATTSAVANLRRIISSF